MEEKPYGTGCNNCGRECNHENDFTLIPVPESFGGGGIWYPQCRWCRAVGTKRMKKWLLSTFN